MNKQRCLFLIVLALSLCLPVFATNISVNAEVDKTEVSFGDSLTLIVTLIQELGNGQTRVMNLPRLDAIPNFDIISSRSGQQTSFVNGVGQAQIQHAYELVPQDSGEFTIPAISFTDQSGKSHKTESIKVKILPPPQQEEKSTNNSSGSAGANKDDSDKDKSSFFMVFLAIGLGLSAIVIPVMILSSIFGKRSKADSKPRFRDEDFIDETKIVGDKNNIEDAKIIAVITDNKVIKPRLRLRKIDFYDEVEKLKRNHSEINKEFYMKYFSLFQQAIIGNSSEYSDSMTSEEILKKAEELCKSEFSKQACQRISIDIDLIIYANRQPSRAFPSIDADAREIIHAIIQ